MQTISPKLLATAYLPDQLIDVPQCAALFLGRSNVGKSSLINALLKKNLAKTAKAPGKTRSLNYYLYLENMVLIDLPGFGYAKVPREELAGWSNLIHAFFEKPPAQALGFLLLDSRRDLEQTEMDLLEALRKSGIACRVLLTKSDRLRQAERVAVMRRLEASAAQLKGGIPLTWTFISAKTGEGIDLLRRLLYRYAQNQEA